MRLPNAAHTAYPWRIHDLAPDFRLEDVWALPARGGPDDFPRLVHTIASFEPSRSSFCAVRMLFAIRWKIGRILGWDDPDAGLGSRVSMLCDRLPPDLRNSPAPELRGAPFRSLYLTEDEWAAEIANQTVHGILHIGWVPDGLSFRGQMAVMVKRNGLLGAGYMSAIKPFRHLIVYPAMMREIKQAWEKAELTAA